MSIQIRPATTADSPSIILLLKTLDVGRHIMTEEISVTSERISRHLTLATGDDSHTILVAEHESGAILGYVAAHWLPYLILVGPEGFVSELFIHPDHRGEGIGRQLIEMIRTEGMNRGCSRLSLLNMRSRESYERRFYQKLGWEERPDAANFVLRLIEPR